MSKHYESGRGLQEKILEGVDILADNVASTLGPRGRNVVLYKVGAPSPIITKDGVTVAKFVDLDDPVQMLEPSLLSKRPLRQTRTPATELRQPQYWQERSWSRHNGILLLVHHRSSLSEEWIKQSPSSLTILKTCLFPCQARKMCDTSRQYQRMVTLLLGTW